MFGLTSSVESRFVTVVLSNSLWFLQKLHFESMFGFVVKSPFFTLQFQDSTFPHGGIESLEKQTCAACTEAKIMVPTWFYKIHCHSRYKSSREQPSSFISRVIFYGLRDQTRSYKRTCIVLNRELEKKHRSTSLCWLESVKLSWSVKACAFMSDF